MRAVNCTQCGATITNVSESSVIIHCDYCGARLILDALPRATEKPEPVTPPEFETESTSSWPLTIGLISAAAIFIPVLIVFSFMGKPNKPVTGVYSAPATKPVPAGWSSSSWSVQSSETPKPVPVINYQPRISWDGPNDIEHFDDPQVDISSVADKSAEEIKKTVFKNRVVKLRVIINTEGEIDEVETISGHPILAEAATASAKRSIFRSRSKPTTRILTYTFRLLKDD